MPSLFQFVVDLLYLGALVGLSLYGINAYVMLALHWRNRRRWQKLEAPGPPALWPRVTVQLPLYNERYVVGRLLEAVRDLDYPADRLEIQLLDDSTDETTEIIGQTLRRLQDKGLTVRHLRRKERHGFKAGALAAGLAQARGDFIAIFDADFVPPQDFLRKTIPHFADPAVAVVQARWGYLNRDYSFLTRGQAFAIDSHLGVEQPARCWGSLFLTFNGTAGVWRKVAVHDAGGWAHDTLTEDLDLSYRAQLRGWRILFLPELVCPAELPALTAGFKSQQRRWAIGSLQTALKLLPAVMRAPLSWWVKYQAFLHLTGYLAHPLMLTVVTLSTLMPELQDRITATPAFWGLGLAYSLVALGPVWLLIYAQRALDPQWWRRGWQLPTIMLIGIGLALSTSLALLSTFWRKDQEFIRTPKFGIGPAGGTWRGKAYTRTRPWGGVIEVGFGIYCAWSAWLMWDDGRHGMLPFLAFCAAGFLAMGSLTVFDASAWRLWPREDAERP
jgi:cellulose synthase/poly-beta-1,6-N-acetylglucosamine synthase-like glycosyltransferase